jgi:protein CpxP
MKNLFLALLLVVGLTATAQDQKGRRAQGRQLTSEQKVDLQVKKMTKDLSLNEKQVTEVRAIITKEVAEREALKADMKAKKAQKKAEAKAKVKEEQAAFVADMKKVLSPEQFAQWEKIREEQKEKLKEKMAARRGKSELKPVE